MMSMEHEVADILYYLGDNLLITKKYKIALNTTEESYVYDIVILETGVEVKGLFLSGDGANPPRKVA